MQAVSPASSTHYHVPLTINPASVFGQSPDLASVQIKQEHQDQSTSFGRRPSSPRELTSAPHKLHPPLDLLENEDATLVHARKLSPIQDFLKEDQEAVLRPDLSAFRNAQDVVERLLPYHVWNVPHEDLLHSLGLKHDPVLNDIRARKTRRLAAVNTPRTGVDANDRLDESSLPDQLVDIAHPKYPSLPYAESLLARRASLMERFKRTTTALETTHKKAPVSSLSLEYLERLAYFDDREQVLDQIEHLRSLKHRLESLEGEKGMRIGTYSSQIRLNFAITQEIEREREREREIERLKRQQERAAAKAAKIDKERELQRKLGNLPCSASAVNTPSYATYGSSFVNTPVSTPGGYFSPTPARQGTISYPATHSTSSYSAGSPYGLPPTPTSVTASSSALRPSSSFASLSGAGASTPSASTPNPSSLAGLTPGPSVHRGRGRPRKHPLPGTPGTSAAELAKRRMSSSTSIAAPTTAQSVPASPNPYIPVTTGPMSYSGEAFSSTLPPTPVGPGSMTFRPPISTMHPTLTSATSLNNPRPSPSSSSMVKTSPSPAPTSSGAPALTTLSAAQAAVPQVLNASVLSNTQSTKPSIPSHPIPLLIPVTSLPRLSALGIQPMPSPHIRPVVGPDGQPSGLSGLPIPLDPNQAVAAILLGVTEGTTDTPDGTKQQILHISVVLSKLNPTQLSGLAVLMQSLQAQVEAEKNKAGIA